MRPISQSLIHAGLQPNVWSPVLQVEDPEGDPAYQAHTLGLTIQAEPANAANATILVQHSADGTTWSNLYTHPAGLVPGGQIAFKVNHTRRYIRVVAWSTGTGQIQAQVQVPEEQALPQLLSGRSFTLTCALECEVSCETGAET